MSLRCANMYSASDLRMKSSLLEMEQITTQQLTLQFELTWVVQNINLRDSIN